MGNCIRELLDLYGWGNAEHTWYFAYGKLYSVGLAGILYAYDLSNGNVDMDLHLEQTHTVNPSLVRTGGAGLT